MGEDSCNDVKKRDVVWYMPQGLCCCDVIRPICCVVFIIVFFLFLSILFIILWVVGVLSPALACEVGVVENGTPSQTTIEHGEKLQYTCDDGYSSKYKTRTCDNGMLKPSKISEPLKCFKKCMKKKFPKEKYLEIADKQIYFNHGQTIKLVCKSGFTYDGELVAKCDEGNIDVGEIKCKRDFWNLKVVNKKETFDNARKKCKEEFKDTDGDLWGRGEWKTKQDRKERIKDYYGDFKVGSWYWIGHIKDGETWKRVINGEPIDGVYNHHRKRSLVEKLSENNLERVKRGGWHSNPKNVKLHVDTDYLTKVEKIEKKELKYYYVCEY